MTSTALAIARETRSKLAQLVRLLSSDQPGEIVAAARAIGRTLRAVGKDFHDLAALIENPSMGELQPAPMPWAAMASFCAATPHRLNERELDFISNMSSLHREPTPAQKNWLIAIYEKLWREARGD